MGTYRRIEHPLFQAYDSNGDPLSGGLVYTYAAGTTTAKATYQEDDTENANPVVLDSTGRAEIYGTGYYKIVLKTSAGVTIWTLDNVAGIGETSITDIGDWAGDFDAAITAIAATETTLYVDSAATMSADVTVPATCTVIIQKGGSIAQSSNALTFNGPLIMQGGTITNDATLTINSVLDAGPYKIFASTTGAVAGNPIARETIPEWWGAVGDGVTNDYTALNAALTHWLQRTVKGEFRFTSGKNYLCNTALSYTISSNVLGGWAINGYGSRITSGLATGYLLTLTSDATVRHLSIKGLYFYGGGSEDGILKLDGATSTEYLYGLQLSDLTLDEYSGNGIFITRNAFETTLNSVSCRTSETTGVGIKFDNGAGGGIVSSINLIGCNVSGSEYGIHCVSPTSDITLYGCTALLAQKEGIYLEASVGNAAINCHVENCYEGAASQAAGGAGLRMDGFGVVIGLLAANTSKMKYGLQMYVTANKSSTVIGGHHWGAVDVTDYAYFTGGAGSSVNYLTSNSYAIGSAQPVTISRRHTVKATNTSVSSGTGEDDLQSYTIPAGTMGNMGGIRVFAAGRKVGANGNKTMKLHFGAESITFCVAANNENSWMLEAVISNYNAENVNRIAWKGYDGITLLTGFTLDAAEDTSAAVIVKITGECAHATDIISQDVWIVESI